MTREANFTSFLSELAFILFSQHSTSFLAQNTNNETDLKKNHKLNLWFEKLCGEDISRNGSGSGQKQSQKKLYLVK